MWASQGHRLQGVETLWVKAQKLHWRYWGVGEGRRFQSVTIQGGKGDRELVDRHVSGTIPKCVPLLFSSQAYLLDAQGSCTRNMSGTTALCIPLPFSSQAHLLDAAGNYTRNMSGTLVWCIPLPFSSQAHLLDGKRSARADHAQRPGRAQQRSVLFKRTHGPPWPPSHRLPNAEFVLGGHSAWDHL